MDDCIFCKIVKGEVPNYNVYEDDNFLAFLDINPRSPGHVQVIPKEHYRWVWDVPKVGEYFEIARKIVKAQQKVFNVEMILCRIVGDEVHHAHIWLIPGDGGTGELKDFIGNAKKLRDVLAK